MEPYVTSEPSYSSTFNPHCTHTITLYVVKDTESACTQSACDENEEELSGLTSVNKMKTSVYTHI